MKLIREAPGGEIHVLYNELLAVSLRDAISRQSPTTPAEPPTEAALVAFYTSLSSEHRNLVDFLVFLHSKSYRLALSYWASPPLEAMDNDADADVH